MADDFDQYESGPLDAEDRQRIRRDFGRTDAIWKTFGWATHVIEHWPKYALLLGGLVALNSQGILAAIQGLLP